MTVGGVLRRQLGTIVGAVPYFAHVDPPLLRHLWSLAVEEQWYLSGRSRFGRLPLEHGPWRHPALIATAVRKSRSSLPGLRCSGELSGPSWFDGSIDTVNPDASTISRCAGCAPRHRGGIAPAPLA